MADTPPVAPVRVVVDDYHGVKVADPYRYLEDFDDPDVQAWVKQQAQFTADSLAAITGRDALVARIRELDAGAPFTISGITRGADGDLFYFKQLAGDLVAKVMLRDGNSGEERLLVDPETFPKSSDDEHFAISFYRVSPEGRRMLYGFAASGSEETTIKILDIDSGETLPDTLERIEAEYALPHWMPDSKSFIYSRRQKLSPDAAAAQSYNFTQAVCHALGKSPDDSPIVFAHGALGSPPMAVMDFPAVIITPNSNWAIGQVRHGDETDITLYAARQADLGSPNIQWRKICGRSDKVTKFAVHQDHIYLVTAHDAPRFKVVRSTLAQPDFAAAEVVVPSGEAVVSSLSVAEDALYVGMLSGAKQSVWRVPFGEARRASIVRLPDDELSASVAAASADISGVLIGARSWTRAERVYAYNGEDGSLTDTRLLPKGKFDAPEDITSTEVFVASHDGERIPLSIIHRKDIQLDGSNPTLLSGYGAYGANSPMRYNPTSLAWLERGGVLAIAHVRGGGTFGKAWHHGGRRSTKPNTWKDFIACAEYLVKAGYTSPAKLAGSGGSAGGILIGRAITERPDLFAAAHIAVGCTDMLRFETTKNGPPNVPEFGSVAHDDEFAWLLKMSTYHHIADGVKYPAVLLTHGVNDPRVEPWQSAKTAARLQAATASGKPILFRVDYQAGHGIGSTKRQRQEELADVWSFVLWQTGELSQ